MKKMAIFASGTGSNAQKIIDHFRKNDYGKVQLIVCNNASAGVLQIASSENIKALLIERNKFMSTGYVSEFKSDGIEFIVLAGFLWKVPEILIASFPGKIINIHPALLPAHGGKGMYGSAVHNAVINAKEKQSGITIHYVDEKYDHGKIIFQKKCDISEDDTAESLAKKIHLLEHKYYAEEIEKILKQ